MRIVLVILLACSVASCSGDDRGRGTSGDFCATYAAQCPGEPDLEECNMECANGTDATTGECWFKACAAMTGKCDNEEQGDPTILLCAIDRGWTDASGGCSDLSDYCAWCMDAAQMSECESVVAAGDERACYEHMYEVQDCRL